ncbi:MAG: metallophosphoesterase [Oligoflexales bacterium]|nr:metallophosphoesterase [Oligoflexales bacterium]
MCTKMILKKNFLLACLFSSVLMPDISSAGNKPNQKPHTYRSLRSLAKLTIPYLALSNGALGQRLVNLDQPTRYLRTRDSYDTSLSRQLMNFPDLSVVSQATNTAEEYDGTMYLGSSDLELTYVRNFQNEQKVGILFNQIDIPQGAKITSASIQFRVDEVSSGSIELDIFGEDTDQAIAYSASRNDVSRRSKTSNRVVWSPDPWTRVGASGSAQKTDITQIIQEIINRPGWQRGNALSLIIQRSRRDNSSNTRIAETDPVITINYQLDQEQAIITARGENPNPGPGVSPEGKAQAFDQDIWTKWVDFSPRTWIQYQYPNARSVQISAYKITSANANPARDPRDWTLEGSDDGSNWVRLDTQSNVVFSGRFQTREFRVSSQSSYNQYRLNILRNNGASAIQLAEIEFVEGYTPPTEDPFFHSHEGAGRVSQTNGYFEWEGQRFNYNSKGGLTSGGNVSTPARTGDHEIVSFGASHGGGNTLKDEYFDEDMMLDQDFTPILVRGEKDKKVEMWIRKNSGQRSINIPRDARAYTFLVLETRSMGIDLQLLDANSVRSAGSPYTVPAVSQNGLKVLSYFSDDTVEITGIGDGALAYQEYGFGDGDGFAVSLYRPGLGQPSRVTINNLDPMGRQYVGINAVFGTERANTQPQKMDLVRPSADAAEERDGIVNLSSSDLELVNDRGEQIVGINFQNINIPKGSSINQVYIQFQTDETSSGNLELEIFAEDTGDSRAFANERRISTRPLTSASAIWRPGNWNVIGEAGSRQRTADLSEILRELTSRSDWKTGNAISFIIKRSPNDQSTNKRVAESGSETKLFVDFTPANAQPSSDVVVLAFGDGGTGDYQQMSVADSMKEVCGFEDCDFAVGLGDNIYENGVSSVNDRQFKTKFEDPYGSLELPFYMSLGNHDVRGNTQAQINYSELSKWWKMPGRYYEKIVDGIQLIALDTNNFDSRQLQFVEDILDNTPAKWKIVFGHHPIYSYGDHGTNDNLVEQLLPVLCEHENVVYMSGHEHDLQVLDSGCGVPLFVSGAAVKLRDVGTGRRTIWADSTYGYAIFRFSDENLKVKYYDEDSQLLYEETYF